MKKHDVTDLKIIKKLLKVSLETSIEIIEKKGPFAFINNGFTIISLGGELKELAAELAYIGNDPDLIGEIESSCINLYPNYDHNIILNTFRKIFSAIIYNVSTGLSIAEDWREYNQGKAQ